MIRTGLDVLRSEGFRRLRGQRIGLVCNQASIAGDLTHAIDLFQGAQPQLELKAIFGPQHGLFGHTQDNMIEWEGRPGPRTGVPIHSLYGEHRKPTPEMLAGLDRMVIDLQDIGARYYTFIWTMLLCLEACAEVGLAVTVLDRPNPIGSNREGPILEDGFTSFVGLKPLPIRHGLAIGELARLFASEMPDFDLTVISMRGYSRDMYFDQTGLPWVMPSPNMPTLDTALVYPGGCLLEATSLSEGRGTTKPFEMLGAPFVDGWEIANGLDKLGLPGCHFRPVEFQPTSNKWAGEVCGGVFVHVTDRRTFWPVLTYVGILQEVRRLYGELMEWRKGPYEYEFEKRPIDILAGNDWLADSIDRLAPLDELAGRMQVGLSDFTERVAAVELY